MSFADYMDSLGAKQVPIGGQANYINTPDGQFSSGYTPIGYTTGQKVPDISRYARSGFGVKDVNGNSGYLNGFNGGNGRFNYTSGFVDKDGGFLGYGNSIASLQNTPGNAIGYSTYAANEPGRIADVEAKNIANKQARFQYEQDYQAAQSAKLAAQQAQPSFANSGLTGLMGQQQAPQQGGYGRGSGFAPGQQYAGGMGRGAGQGLIGGMGRGGPTGGGQ